MKLAFVIQFYPYQYYQFKYLIDYLKADVFYTTPQDKSARGLFDINGNKVDVEYFSNYDAAVFNHPYKKYFTKIRMQTKSKKSCQITHSLLGTFYDIKCAACFNDPFIGSIMPRDYLKVGSWRRYHEKFSGYFPEMTFVDSNPICCRFKDLDITPVKKGSLGIILGEFSPVDSILLDAAFLDTYYDFSEIHMRTHPLKSTVVAEKLMIKSDINGKRIILDESRDYNSPDKFISNKEYLIGGSSSLMIEASLISRIQNKDQKILFHQSRRDIDLGFLKEFDEKDPAFSLARDSNLYSNFMHIDDILEQHKLAIEESINRDYSRKYYEWNLMKHMFQQDKLPEEVL